MEVVFGYLIHNEEKISIKHQNNAFLYQNNTIQDCSGTEQEKIEFEIIIEDFQWVLYDKSQNGVLVNNAKVGYGNQVVLTHASHICVRDQYYYELQIISALTYQQQLLDLQKRQIQEKQDLLEDQILCSICDQCICQAMAITPCMHHFCGECLNEWVINKNTCPSCNIVFKGIYPSPILNNLVDKYLELAPEKKRPAFGQDQVIKDYILIENNDNDNDNQNINQDKQDDIQQMQPKKQQEIEIKNQIDQYLNNKSSLRFKPTLISQQPLFINTDKNSKKKQEGKLKVRQTFQFYIKQYQETHCKSCEGQEWKGFQCKEGQEHVGCNSCFRRIPKRMLSFIENQELKMQCSICQVYDYCVKAKENKFLLVKDLYQYFTIKLSPINQVEQQRLLENLNGQDENTIFTFMCDNYISQGLFLFEQNDSTFKSPQINIESKLYEDSPICYMCGPKLSVQIIWKYVRIKKAEHEEINLPDCPQGINCKQKDKQHQQDHNHMCQQTKFD